MHTLCKVCDCSFSFPPRARGRRRSVRLVPVQRSLLRPATNPLHAPLRRCRPGPKAQAWRCVRFWGQREVHSFCRACLAALQPHPAARRSHLVQGINRLGKGTAKPGTLRPTDPNRFKTEDFFSVEAEGDPEYLRRIVEVRDPQNPALQLACSSCACALPAMCLFTRLASGVHTWSGWCRWSSWQQTSREPCWQGEVRCVHAQPGTLWRDQEPSFHRSHL